jgi:hypothetical protein
LKKNYFSSHKLPKQQSTSFWSQGILGVKWILGRVQGAGEMALIASLETQYQQGTETDLKTTFRILFHIVSGNTKSTSLNSKP